MSFTTKELSELFYNSFLSANNKLREESKQKIDLF